MLAPIVLFVYNRPWHTEETLKALMLNELADESVLYIYCDGPKKNASPEDISKIEEVRAVIRKKKWCKEVIIIENNKNLGLANSIIKGVTEVVEKYGKIIVLEDDIVTSISFLNYINDALNEYEKVEKVMHISGYFPETEVKLPDFFFYNQTSCWGWATWKNSWLNYNENIVGLHKKLINSNRILEFNMNNSYPFLSHLEANLTGDIKTWAIKWHASVFLKKGLCLHPAKSYVNNIGFDNTGVHCEVSNKYNIENLSQLKFKKVKKLIENKNARKSVEKFHRNEETKSFYSRIMNKIKSIIKL